MNVLFNRDGDDEYVQRFALRELAEDWIERVVQDKPDDPYQYLMEEAEQQRRSAGGIVTCENRWCGMTMPASMYPSHLVTCNDAENWVRCLCCNERVEVSKLAKHRLHCRIERCPHCGEMVLPRMLMMCPHKLMQEVERARTAASRRSTKLKQQNTHPLESSVQDEILALTDNGSIFVPTTSNLRGEDGSIHTTANSSSSSHNANPTTTSSTNNNNHRVRGATTLVASPSDGANTAPLGWSAATTSGEQIPRRHSVNSSPPPGLPNFAQTTTRPSLLTLAQKRGMGNPNTARFAPPMMGAVDDGGGGGGDPLSDDHRLSIIQRLWRRSLFVQRVRENFFRAVWEQLDLSSEVSGNTRMQARIQHGLLRSDASQSFAVTDSNTSNTSAAMSHNSDGMSTKDDDVSDTGSVAAARHESMLPDASNGPSLRTLEMNDIIAGGLALPIPRDDDEDAWSTEANNGAEEPIHVRLSPHDDGTYMDVRDLDALGRRNAERKMLRAGTVVRIVRAAIAILQTRSPVTHVVIPPRGEVVVVGDLHGQMNDLCHLLSITGGPTARRYYIFNGDLVDRGPYGNEVILYVFALLITYPQYVFINRGNHEDYRTNVEYGFMTELMGKYSSRAAHIHELFAQSYAVMPLITVVDRRVAVLHGGVPRVACTLQEVEALGHVRDVPVAQQSTREEMILSDLLWNDPVTKFRSRQLGVQHQGDGWRSSKRGCGAEYLAAVTDRFLELNNLSMIIRSHEVVSSGFEMIHRNKSVTVFSASNYGGVSGNRGAIAIITKEARKPSFQTWYFKEDKKSVEKLRKGRGGSSTGATDEAMIDFVGMYPCSDEFLRSFYGPQSPLTADDVGVSSGGGSEANFSDSGTSFGSSRGSSMMNDSTASHNNNHHHHDGELGTTMDVDDELGEDGRDTSPIKPLPEVLATRELTGTASPSRRRRRASHNSSLKYRPHDLSTQSSHLSMMVQLRSIQSIRELIFLHRYGLLTAFNQVDELRTGIVYKVEWAVVMRDVLNMDLPWYYLCQFLTPRLEVDGIPAVEYVRFLRHFDSPFLQAYRRGWQRATVARVFSGVDMPDELVRAFTEDRSMTPVNSSVPAIPQSISQVPSMGSGALFDTRSNLLASSVSSTDDLWDGWKEVQVDFKSFATKIRSLSPTAAVMEDNDIYSFFAFFDREMYGHVFLGQMVERIGEVMDEGSDGEPELISGDLDFTTVRRNTDQSSATRARTAPQAATNGKPPAASGDVASNSSSTNRSTPSKFNGLLRSAKAFTSKPAPSPSSSGSEDSRQDKAQRIQLHRLSVRTPISFSDLDAERVVEEEAGSPPSTGSNPAVIITDATNDRAPTTFHLTSPQHGRSAAVPAPSAVGLVPITTSTNCAAASTTGGAGSSVAGSSGKMNVSIASPLLENTANSSTTHFERSIRVSGAPQPAAVGAVLDEEDLKRMEGLTREEIGFQMPWLYGTFIRIQEQLLGGNSVTRLQSIFTALNQDKDGRLSEKEFTPLVTLLNEQLEHPLSELQARIIFKCVRIDAMVQSSPYRQANLNLRHMDFHSHALGDLQPFVEPQRLADESVVGKRYVLLPEFIFILSISPVALVDETIFHSHVGGGTVALPAVAQAASAESAGSFPYGTQLFAVRGGGAPPTKLEVSTNSMQLTMKVLRERFGDGATLHEVLGALERLTPSENSCSTDRPRFLNSNTSRPHMRRLLSSNRSKASLERSATSFKSGLDTDASTPTSRPESAMRQYRLNILTEYRMTVPTLSPATGRHRLSIQTLTDAPSFISASHSTMLRPSSTMGNYAAATAATATFMPIQAPGSSAILTAGHRHFNSSVGSMSGAVPHNSTHTSTHTSAHPSSTRSRPPAIPAPPITRKSSPSPQETIPTLESQVTLTPDDSNLQHQPPSQSETQHAHHSRHGSPAGPSTSHDSRGSGAAPSSPSMSIAISDATTSVGSPASPLKTTPVRLKRSTQSDFTLLRSRGGTGQSQAQSQRLKGSHTTTTTTNHNNTPPTMLMVPAGIHPLPLKPLQPTLAGSAAAARAQAGLSAGANNNNNNSAVPLPGVVPAAMSKSPSSSTLSTRTSTTAPAPSDQPCGGFRGAGSRPSTRPSSPPTPPPLGGASLESIRARLRTIKEKAHHHSSTLSEGGGGGGSSSSRCSSRLGRHNSRSRGHASSAGHA